MNYYKYPDEYSGMANAVTYIETDENGCHFRELTTNGTEYFASNVLNPPWGPILGEGCIEYAEYVESGEVEAITVEEFAAVWQKHLARRKAQWEMAKRTYTIGRNVQGSIEIFFPQGVIVNMTNDVLAIADYVACRASTQPENMYPKHKVSALVNGYDEANQWIVLESPQVHSETVE